MDQFGFEEFEIGGQGLFHLAEARLDPAGVTVEGFDVAGLAEDPGCGLGFVAFGVLEAGVEECPLPTLLEDPMAVEYPPVVVESAAGGVGEATGFLFGASPKVSFEPRRHPVYPGEEAGAAGVLGDGGFAGGRAGAGRFPCVGPVGGEALFRNEGQSPEGALRARRIDRLACRTGCCGGTDAEFTLLGEAPGGRKFSGGAVDFRDIGVVHRNILYIQRNQGVPSPGEAELRKCLN
ncbi:MAG: hypothetical protein QM757_22280 [Paludibaculum sp.]